MSYRKLTLNRVWLVGAALIFICLTALLSSQAAPGRAVAPGDVDFSINGGPGVFNDVVIGPDGKIFAVGTTSDLGISSVVISRYGSDGTKEASANIYDNGGTDFSSYGMALQPDNKVVAVGGTSAGNMLLMRFTGDAKLDPTFDGNGIKFTRPYSFHQAAAYTVVVQPDGKIVAAGRNGFGSDGMFVLVRLNSDGSRDLSFGTQGFVLTNYPSHDTAHDILLQPDGKLIAVGGGNGDFALARYNSNGALDTSFSSDGLVTTDFGQDLPDEDFAYGAVLQPDGKIVVAGTAGHDYFALARYNSNGSLDTSFGKNGLVTTNILIGDCIDEIKGMALQANGKIVVAGSICGLNYMDWAVARYNSNGSLDTSFGGGDGWVTTPFVPDADNHSDSGQAVAIQPDGKIVVAGYHSVVGEDERILIRYFGGDGSGPAPTPTPALSVSKTAQPDPVAPGGILTYTIQVRNNGPTPLHAIITDTLPSHVSPGGLQVWTATLPASGGVWNQTLVVTVAQGYTGTLVNRVNVTTAEGFRGSAQAITNGKKTYVPLVIKN